MTLAAEGTFNADLMPLVVALPLFGAVVLLLFGRRLGAVSAYLATGTIGLAFLLGVVTFVDLLGADGGHGEHSGREAIVHLFDWIVVGDFSATASLLVDQLSMTMVLVVTGVGALIHVYSIGYMHGDPRYSRYFAYLNLFAAAMLLLVLGDNLVVMFVGWEGVGLCSYLLIGFWFEKDSAANAAKKAFIVNRIGDFSFLLGIFLLAATAGSVVFGDVNQAAETGTIGAGIATIGGLLLFGGATGKSAQIPLYVWLPDAMEGPTPVSALIHAATMVTAGVYMVVRLSPLFEGAGPEALTVIAWVGGATALFAAVMAVAEYDIKKVLAYSTISQLGYMFMAVGVGAYAAAIFHLVTHAFFKALMFLGAGAVMHGLDGETDMRRMGGLRKAMPITGGTFMLGWLAISGIVPFSGFFSKDAILAGAWAEGQYPLWALGIATAALTAFYMSRLYFRIFEGPLRHPEGTHPHDPPLTMVIALVPLGILSVVGGAINLPELLTFEHFLEPVVGEAPLPEGLTLYLLAGAALLVAASGILIARSLYMTPEGSRRRLEIRRRLGVLVPAAQNKFWIDDLYGRTIVGPGHRVATYMTEFDSRGLDGAVNGAAGIIAWSGEWLRRIQTGYIRNYEAAFLVGVVVVLSLLVLRMIV